MIIPEKLKIGDTIGVIAPSSPIIGDNVEDKEIFELGQELCIYNNNEKNDGTYFLLSIELNKLQNDVRFYYDPNSSIGIFT